MRGVQVLYYVFGAPYRQGLRYHGIEREVRGEVQFERLSPDLKAVLPFAGGPQPEIFAHVFLLEAQKPSPEPRRLRRVYFKQHVAVRRSFERIVPRALQQEPCRALGQCGRVLARRVGLRRHSVERRVHRVRRYLERLQKKAAYAERDYPHDYHSVHVFRPRRRRIDPPAALFHQLFEPLRERVVFFRPDFPVEYCLVELLYHAAEVLRVFGVHEVPAVIVHLARRLKKQLCALRLPVPENPEHFFLWLVVSFNWRGCFAMRLLPAVLRRCRRLYKSIPYGAAVKITRLI